MKNQLRNNRLVQHDMDARPLMPRHEIPLPGFTYFDSGPHLMSKAEKAVQRLIDTQIDALIEQEHIERFSLGSPALFIGAIASGDQFFSGQSDKDALLLVLPDVRCVEMEGAAVAQACYENGLPFVVIRITFPVSMPARPYINCFYCSSDVPPGVFRQT